MDLNTLEVAETQIATTQTSMVDTLLDIIPKNPIESLATGNMLQIIVFAIIVGIILAKLGDKTQIVHNLFQQGNDIMMEMTMMVMSLAPIGVFCLIARTFSGMGFDAFQPLIKYMFAVMLALVIQCLGVYQILLKVFTGLNPIRFIKKFLPVMGFAFSTATSMRPFRCRLIRWSARWAYRAAFRPLPSRWARPSIWMVRPSCRA